MLFVKDWSFMFALRLGVPCRVRVQQPWFFSSFKVKSENCR